MYLPSWETRGGARVRVACPGQHPHPEVPLPRVEPATARDIPAALEVAFAIGPWDIPEQTAILAAADVPLASVLPCPHCPSTWALVQTEALLASAHHGVQRDLGSLLRRRWADGTWDGEPMPGPLRGSWYAIQPRPALHDGAPGVDWDVMGAGGHFQYTTDTPAQGRWLIDLMTNPAAQTLITELVRGGDLDAPATARDALA